MSEEEKAIETLKEVASDDFDTLGDDISPKMAQNILNVIERQQKEMYDFKIEHKIMQRIIRENGLWKTLLNDKEFKKHLKEEN